MPGVAVAASGVPVGSLDAGQTKRNEERVALVAHVTLEIVHCPSFSAPSNLSLPTFWLLNGSEGFGTLFGVILEA